MPELPEVESIRKQINKILPARVQEVRRSKYCQNLDISTEWKIIKDCPFKSVDRRGKYLIFDCDNKYFFSHLGMTGSWRISENKLDEKHVHLQLKFASSLFLSYVDPRRFGNFRFIKNKDKFLEKYGPDISEPTFNIEWINKICDRFPKKILKKALLDQKLFFGVGNYMASEICAHAKILPLRTLETLSLKDKREIIKSIKIIIKGGTKLGGVTFQGGYKNTKGEAGLGVQNLVVFYQKECQMCKNNNVVKIMIDKRGTYYCPQCQI